MYEFVQKLAKKKRNQVGISTRDQYGLQSLRRYAIHLPVPVLAWLFAAQTSEFYCTLEKLR
jgi:hypothetical protein